MSSEGKYGCHGEVDLTWESSPRGMMRLGMGKKGRAPSEDKGEGEGAMIGRPPSQLCFTQCQATRYGFPSLHPQLDTSCMEFPG